MYFNDFLPVFSANFADMIASGKLLYTVDADKHTLWQTYLESFPIEERQSHNCNSCRSFIKSFGHLVIIDDDYNLRSIWDFTVNDPMWQTVVNNLRNIVYCCRIRDVFVPESTKLGHKSNIQKILDPITSKLISTLEWHHLYLEVPRSYVTGKTAQDYRDPRNSFKLAMDEFDPQTLEIALELVDQGLYKGVEYKHALETFLQEQRTFISMVLTQAQIDNYLWVAAARVGVGVAKIRGSLIGLLLKDIAKGEDVDTARAKYETAAAPQNYRRTQTTSVSQRQTYDAEKTAKEEGLLDSFPRRHARLPDISVQDVLWLNCDSEPVQSVFGVLRDNMPTDVRKFARIDEVGIDDFVANILPKSTSMELLLESKHTSNLMSLIAPAVADAKSLTRWTNNFSWYYTGDVTDSIIKQNVEKAGGCINAVLRFSIQWNDNGDNNIDFDAHADIKRGEEINFRTYRKPQRSPASGQLDVDIINPDGNVAVENIVYNDINSMPQAEYHFYVNNYSGRISNGGFTAEIEYNGVTYSYAYNTDLKPRENITVAKFNFSRQNGLQFIESLDSNSSIRSKEVWGMQTNTWQPVSVAMLSPNYWHNGDNIGNKHFFFILEKARNNDPVVRGFYNEFITPVLYPHRKVFELLGRRLLVSYTDEQLSGVGFSSTLRNNFLVKVKGASERVLRVTI